MSSKNFVQYFTSFDVFGEPVSLNYGGEKMYRTAVGALFSIATQTFLLVYAII